MAQAKKPTRHRSAIKANRQAMRRYTHNRAIKKHIRLGLRAVAEALGSEDKAKLPELVSKASSLLDKAARRGAIHWKAAARRKSRLARQTAQTLAAQPS